MPITSNKNLYPGVNAHLNSFLQQEGGGWESFHKDHITYLREALDEHLPPGYFTFSEKSLQIGEFDPGSGREARSKLVPDVTVYRTPKITTRAHVGTVEVSSPTLTFPLPSVLDDEQELSGLVIYQAGEGSLLGRPVTRVEILSPANKPTGSYYRIYREKQFETLKSGLRLVEIDYLHQTPPVDPRLPSYIHQDKNAFPYMICVSDPRPTFEQGTLSLYGFLVDSVIGVISIPLAGADVVLVDFGRVYNRTFESWRFAEAIVDYEQDPVNFDRYTPEDQAKIRALLAEIRKNAAVDRDSS